MLHLAARYVDRVVDELLPHYGADCPVAVVAMASRPDEVILRGTLADIAAQVKAAGLVRTAVILVGPHARGASSSGTATCTPRSATGTSAERAGRVRCRVRVRWGFSRSSPRP